MPWGTATCVVSDEVRWAARSWKARYVSADGRVIKAGGPTVKNVSGYDLCRLLVGSLGTLGLIGEVVLRTRPRRPRLGGTGTTDPFALAATLYRPDAVLWDGTTTWLLLEGHPGDVEQQGAIARRAGSTTATARRPCLPTATPSGPTRCDTSRVSSLPRSGSAPCTARSRPPPGPSHRRSPSSTAGSSRRSTPRGA